MPKCTERIIRILISHGADSLCIVPDPDSQLPLLILIRPRRHHHIRHFTVALDRQHQILSFRFFHRLDKMLLVLHHFPVYFKDIVSLLQCIFSRRDLLSLTVLKLTDPYHKHATRLYIDTDRNSRRNQHLVLDHFHVHIFIRYHPKKFQIHLVSINLIRPDLYSMCKIHGDALHAARQALHRFPALILRALYRRDRRGVLFPDAVNLPGDRHSEIQFLLHTGAYFNG